ncbi:PREDICTED: uncharacterized protein LOC105360361 [Ceratosolen solmsi marchali]|uniref:Uncharacterized protein LOC105360361 n=1 Tax=Ceratosolen solmsi marchali TaxID=326594 RepID=A0AAJ6YCV3_9HYME|nr:PREDICTED: uncharacterized protein LOC105360361 [Ceratosolen solmsi marchali]
MYLLVIAGFLILCHHYDSTSASPIVGLNVRFAQIDEFPYVASIKRSNINNIHPETDHLCTGVLVSPRDVLTVDHCFYLASNQHVEIIIGRNNIRHGRIFHVSWWMSYNEWITVRHVTPQYINNDITMIRLTSMVPSSINPVSLWPFPDINLFGKTATVAAFGTSEFGVRTRLMETAELKIITRTECQNIIERFHSTRYQINEKYLCARSTPFTILTNDNSGAAVLFQDMLVGIHRGTYPDQTWNNHEDKLTENVNEMIVPAELSRIPDTMLGHLTGVVAAFGREIRDHISNFMETASLIVLSRRTCETRLRRMREEFIVTENVVCGANKPVVLMSKGNRGAPLIQNGRLLGIYRDLIPAGGDEYAPNKINLFIKMYTSSTVAKKETLKINVLHIVYE